VSSKFIGLIPFRVVIPGRCAASNPESRSDSFEIPG
jgi:hypothetical protein